MSYSGPKVTKVVKIRHVNKGSLKAFVTVEMEKCFEVRDLRVMEGSKGRFLAMPAREAEGKDGKKFYVNLFHPLLDDGGPGSELKAHMEEVVLEAWQKSAKESKSNDW